MGNELELFFDSYALIEIFAENPKFDVYADVGIITTYFQVYEVYYSLRRVGYTQEEIEPFVHYLSSCCIVLDSDWLSDFVDFKLKYKKRKLSYADCLGYVISQKKGLKFLTGDKEFEDISGVEFVKK
ncbi:MAG: putative nucleic acid-binding protein [Patescibacteria group bacterium]|jgi:predicted nucleic acid-binding protein